MRIDEKRIQLQRMSSTLPFRRHHGCLDIDGNDGHVILCVVIFKKYVTPI